MRRVTIRTTLAGLLMLMLTSPLANAQSVPGSAEGLSVRAIQDRLLGTGEKMPSVAGSLVAAYLKQAPEVICTGINIDPSQTHEVIAAALAAGATGDQIPQACECTESNEGIVSLVQGALTNGIGAADLASSCLQQVTNASVLKSLLASLLGAASGDDFPFILATTYDVLVDLKVDDAVDLLVDALVDGEFLSLDGDDSQCGEACTRPIAETLVQSVVDVQEGGGQSRDIVGEPEPSASSS